MENSCLSRLTEDYKLTITDKDIDVFTSFPISETTCSAGTIRHPFFTFSTLDNAKKLQWQVHPLETGPLRYTLVEIAAIREKTDKNSLPEPNDIRAIYHHIGQGPSLSVCDGEGVLLLPADTSKDSSVTEEVAVASLLGLLWRVREMTVQPPAAQSLEDGKKSLLGRIFKKY